MTFKLVLTSGRIGFVIAWISTKDHALFFGVPEDLVVSIVTKSMTFDFVPEVFRNPEDIFGRVEFGGSYLWSGCDGITPELEAFFEVAINVKENDAVTANASEDANGLNVWITLAGKGHIGWAELVVKGRLSRIFATSPLAGLHPSALAKDWCVYQAFWELLDEFGEVHVLWKS